jgi:hypothetical protein
MAAGVHGGVGQRTAAAEIFGRAAGVFGEIEADTGELLLHGAQDADGFGDDLGADAIAG